MEAAEKAFLSNSHISTIEEVNGSIDWRKFNAKRVEQCCRRKKVLANVIPETFIPCVSTGEGDCLFCAVSLLLFGSEGHQKDLQFAAVHYAILHVDHYLQN